LIAPQSSYASLLRLGDNSLTICTASGKRSLRARNAGRGAEAADAFLEAAKGASRTGSQGAEDQLELTTRRQAALRQRSRRARLELLRAVLTELGESIPKTPGDAIEGFYQTRV